MYVTLCVCVCVTDGGLYLCFSLWSDSSNVLLYHEANVDLLQELGHLQQNTIFVVQFNFDTSTLINTIAHLCRQDRGE